MLGLRAFAWIDAPLHQIESTFIATCVCSNVRREQRVAQDASDAAAVDAAVAVGFAAIAQARAAEAIQEAQAAAAAENAARASDSPLARPAYVRAPRRVVSRGTVSLGAMEQV